MRSSAPQATSRRSGIAQGNEQEAIPGERILADCRTIFDARDVDRLATADLLDALRADDEAPWESGAGTV